MVDRWMGRLIERQIDRQRIDRLLDARINRIIFGQIYRYTYRKIDRRILN